MILNSVYFNFYMYHQKHFYSKNDYLTSTELPYVNMSVEFYIFIINYKKLILNKIWTKF